MGTRIAALEVAEGIIGFINAITHIIPMEEIQRGSAIKGRVNAKTIVCRTFPSVNPSLIIEQPWKVYTTVCPQCD
ncbi:MAG: hypothetical protein PUA70_07570, partial [Oribacterium sp.]|nr:hypothetical protein [Oribacterium sp.]